jgi:hypothetical protein
MKQQNESILNEKISPFKQAGYAIVVAIVLMTLSKFMPVSAYSTTAKIMPWTALCGVILFFAIGNSILSLGASAYKYYWMHSMISYASLLVVGGFLAYMFTGIGIYDAGSVSWLYLVLTFCYLVFLSIVNLIKFFVNYAQNDVN